MKHNLFDPYTAPLGLLLADSQLETLTYFIAIIMSDRGTLINNAKPLLYPVYLERIPGSAMEGKAHCNAFLFPNRLKNFLASVCFLGALFFPDWTPVA